MTLSVGDKLPNATLLQMGDDGPEPVELSSLTKGRKVVIFALPGAYTGTCTTAHVPSFMRTKPDFDKKGVDEVICISVNDPFVMQAWGESTGATEAGITMLGDADGSFTRDVGMVFDAPPAGLINRSRRYALYAEDGVVKVLNAEENPGVCETSGGEALLADMQS
ncbi:peroxiredoxin [Aliiroseovarius sediminis]|uniref:peroxiredoxin n=1 Tax=Aliiroseovarius sediminis TaxID=2925839 RepID=UPI001F57271A|nr:peroxiredoxin [Aliiroseovarius sediminis]MCI2395500.1 peroxiredoxin [Aliiroseovarius sediminis]